MGKGNDTDAPSVVRQTRHRRQCRDRWKSWTGYEIVGDQTCLKGRKLLSIYAYIQSLTLFRISCHLV